MPKSFWINWMPNYPARLLKINYIHVMGVGNIVLFTIALCLVLGLLALTADRA